MQTDVIFIFPRALERCLGSVYDEIHINITEMRLSMLCYSEKENNAFFSSLIWKLRTR